MYSRTIRTGAFLLESVSSVAMVYYFYYLYFFTAEHFDFGNRRNLLLAALSGGIYTFAALYGGRFGQRRGYFAALKTGYALMIGSMAAGLFVTNLAGHIVVFAAATVGMCFIWPTLEAVVCEGASPLRTQKMVGIYNLVWATSNAVAFFTGGALIEAFGYRVIFTIPLGLYVAQLAFTFWLERQARGSQATPPEAAESLPVTEIPPNPRPIARARTFLHIAWIANPLGYVAMSTVLPVIPSIARDLQMTPAMAGVFCSIWQFGRAATFLALWHWTAWHYRFRWMAAACAALVAGFVLILGARDLTTLILAQLIFGAGAGLIYYSSLFYSMDVGETKGEHGGFHEAAIGAGNFVGPMIGAGALTFFPATPHSGTLAVSAVLVLGFTGIATIYMKNKPSFHPRQKP